MFFVQGRANQFNEKIQNHLYHNIKSAVAIGKAPIVTIISKISKKKKK